MMCLLELKGAGMHISGFGSCCSAPNGTVEILLNDGKEHTSVMLDSPNKALLIGPGLWRDMVWHTDRAVLCVAASEHYDESDYIRNYEEFLRYTEQDRGEEKDG